MEDQIKFILENSTDIEESVTVIMQAIQTAIKASKPEKKTYLSIKMGKCPEGCEKCKIEVINYSQALSDWEHNMQEKKIL